MKYLASFFSFLFHEQDNGYTLPYVKYILVLTAVRTGFFFQAVAVQVKNVNFIKSFHKALAHAAKRGIIQVAVIGNHPHDAKTHLMNFPLGETQELYIIVL